MSQLAEKTWEEELKERFLREGEARGVRSSLQMVLQQRFGTLPEGLLQQIASGDIEQLNAALAVVLTLHSLDDLAL